VTGWLPPIAEGLDPCANGILVDLPEGMTFEYRGDDIRLLGVRDGRLKNAESTGAVWFLRHGGSPGSTFRIERSGGAEDLLAKRPAMRIGWYHPPAVIVRIPPEEQEYGTPPFRMESVPGRQMPVLSYRLERLDGTVVARVEESLRSVSTASTKGFVRRFVIRREKDEEVQPLQLSLDVLDTGDLVEPVLGRWIGSGPPSDLDWRLDTVGRNQSGGVRHSGDQQVLVVWSRPPGLQGKRRDNPLVLEVLKGEPFRLEVVTFVFFEWSEEVWAEIREVMYRR
jgi:hypothetical protein